MSCFWECGPGILNWLVWVNSEAPYWLSSSGYNSLTPTTDHPQLISRNSGPTGLSMIILQDKFVFFHGAVWIQWALVTRQESPVALSVQSSPLRGPSSSGRNLNSKDSLAWTSSEIFQEGLKLCPYSPFIPWDNGLRVPTFLITIPLWVFWTMSVRKSWASSLSAGYWDPLASAAVW